MLGMLERARTALALLIWIAAALPAVGEDEIVRFQSELSSGQEFRQSIGHGLVLVLAPGDGWTIQVSPQKITEPECGDFAWVVNPPFRSYNALYLNVSYGVTAELRRRKTRSDVRGSADHVLARRIAAYRQAGRRRGSQDGNVPSGARETLGVGLQDQRSAGRH